MNCLLIKTKDNRQFFTENKNYPLLIEFANTFKAELCEVQAESPEILNLEKLAQCISDGVYTCKTNFRITERKTFRNKKKTKAKNNVIIQEYIKEKFLSGQIVKLHDVANEFKHLNLSISTFCNHISQIRKQLIKQNYEINKLGGGIYQLTK